MNNLNVTKSSSIGRRKTSIAAVILKPTLNPNMETSFIINGKINEQYFNSNFHYLNKVKSPFQKLEIKNQYEVIVSVKGGGLTGQVDAIILALSRALCKLDNKNFRPSLKIAGFLSRDSRIKERRKYGLKKARKASQSSKR